MEKEIIYRTSKTANAELSVTNNKVVKYISKKNLIDEINETYGLLGICKDVEMVL